MNGQVSTRLLERTSKKILRAQRRNACARRCHTNETRRVLRSTGIKLTETPVHYVVVCGLEKDIEWLTRAVVGSTVTTALTAILLLPPVAFNFESPKARLRGHAYYPQLGNIRRGLRLLHVRLILMIGGLLVVGYYTVTVIQVSWPQQSGYMLCLPPRVWISCHLLWGLLWLADCASRPNRDMVKVAIGYLCIVALFLLFGGFRTEGV